VAKGGKFTNYSEGRGSRQSAGEGNAKDQAGRAALKWQNLDNPSHLLFIWLVFSLKSKFTAH